MAGASDVQQPQPQHRRRRSAGRRHQPWLWQWLAWVVLGMHQGREDAHRRPSGATATTAMHPLLLTFDDPAMDAEYVLLRNGQLRSRLDLPIFLPLDVAVTGSALLSQPLRGLRTIDPGMCLFALVVVAHMALLLRSLQGGSHGRNRGSSSSGGRGQRPGAWYVAWRTPLVTASKAARMAIIVSKLPEWPLPMCVLDSAGCAAKLFLVSSGSYASLYSALLQPTIFRHHLWPQAAVAAWCAWHLRPPLCRLLTATEYGRETVGTAFVRISTWSAWALGGIALGPASGPPPPARPPHLALLHHGHMVQGVGSGAAGVHPPAGTGLGSAEASTAKAAATCSAVVGFLQLGAMLLLPSLLLYVLERRSRLRFMADSASAAAAAAAAAAAGPQAVGTAATTSVQVQWTGVSGAPAPPAAGAVTGPGGAAGTEDGAVAGPSAAHGVRAGAAATAAAAAEGDGAKDRGGQSVGPSVEVPAASMAPAGTPALQPPAAASRGDVPAALACAVAGVGLVALAWEAIVWLAGAA